MCSNGMFRPFTPRVQVLSISSCNDTANHSGGVNFSACVCLLNVVMTVMVPQLFVTQLRNSTAARRELITMRMCQDSKIMRVKFETNKRLGDENCCTHVILGFSKSKQSLKFQNIQHSSHFYSRFQRDEVIAWCISVGMFHINLNK